MTADQRLDQLEPILAENVAILDRHTAQLKRLDNSVTHLSAIVGRLADAVNSQSDNIGFLLREQAEIKARLITLETDVASLKTDVASLKTGQVSTNEKLDLLIRLVSPARQ